MEYAISQVELYETNVQTQTVEKSADLDKNHQSMVKTGLWLHQALMLLFNKLFNERIWLWKSGRIMFIAKKRNVDYTTPASYGHTALTSNTGKPMETILLKRVIDFLEITVQTDENQESSKKQRSTGRSTACLTANIQRAVQSKKKPVAIFLDYDKAFD